MKSLLNAFSKKEGKERAVGCVAHRNEQFLTDSPGELGPPFPPKIAGRSSPSWKGIITSGGRKGFVVVGLEF